MANQIVVQRIDAQTTTVGAIGPQGAQGPQGPQGFQGPIGLGYQGITSTTSITIGTGSKTFTLNKIDALAVGTRVRVVSSANSANFVEGAITSVASLNIVVNVDSTGGTGTIASWNIAVAGVAGAQGPAGIVIQATAPANTALAWADTTATGSLFAPYRLTTSTKSANYTLALTDEQTFIEVSAVATITVPTNSSVAFPIGTQIHLLATGAGAVTVSPFDGTVTVNATPSLVLRAQWSSATLIKRAINTWVLIGDLA
jgi:hypothetical protein